MSTILKYIVVCLQLLLIFKGPHFVSGFWISDLISIHNKIIHNDLFFENPIIAGFHGQSLKSNEVLRVHSSRTQAKHISSALDAGNYRVRQKKRTAYDVIKELGATEFLRLASAVRLDSLLKNPTSNITVFAPTNEAMLQVSPNLCSNLSSMDMIIRFHLVKGFVQLSNITQNGMLSTFAKYGQNTSRFGLKIRTNIYNINKSKIFSVSGAKIVTPNQKGNGTIVHLVNKALFPLPTECAYNTILHHPGFSILTKLITKSFTLLRVLCDSGRNLTFFAPTDEAFKKLSADVFTKLQKDVVLLTQVFVKHIASNTTYSVGIVGNSSVKGVPGNKILLKNMQNKFLVTVDKVTGLFSIPDISVKNGVIHGIDTVLYYSNPNSNVDIIG